MCPNFRGIHPWSCLFRESLLGSRSQLKISYLYGLSPTIKAEVGASIQRGLIRHDQQCLDNYCWEKQHTYDLKKKRQKYNLTSLTQSYKLKFVQIWSQQLNSQHAELFKDYIYSHLVSYLGYHSTVEQPSTMPILNCEYHDFDALAI